MSQSIQQLIAEVHETSTRLVIALSGGGARAIAELLEVPGASRTVLEAAVPYSPEAVERWLGGPPHRFCSEETARAMAMAAFVRACRLQGTQGPLAGVASTASLATDRPKRGPHRAHVAIQTAASTASSSIHLEKGRRSRAEEERLVSLLVLGAVAEACGLERRLAIELRSSEAIQRSEVVAPEPWRDLLLGRVEAVPHGAPADPTGEPGRAIFPGAFHPLHDGHRRMAEIAQKMLGLMVEFEITVLNVDKPPLDYCEMERRTGQFQANQTVWLTRLATFEQKSRRFRGATFIVGADTMRRIADRRYYGDDEAACRSAIEAIAARGCRFLVFGRREGDRFVTLNDLDLPESLRSISSEVPADRFRHDVSSTEIRESDGP